jgi:hypothetical protein
MLPTLQSVVAADAARVQDAFDDAQLALIQLALAALVVLAGLAAIQIWLAGRTRRNLNIPLTWGTAAVLVTIVLGALTMVGSQRSVNDVRDTSYTATRALAEARIAAYDAKANESLTLVYQGTGQSFETAYQGDLKTARDQLDAAQGAGVGDVGQQELEAWNTTHGKIRELDTSGDWQGAVNLAVNQTSKGSSGQFAEFANATAPVLSREAAAVSDGLTSSHWLLVLLGWLTLLVGISAAVLAWTGIGQRLVEYR